MVKEDKSWVSRGREEGKGMKRKGQFGKKGNGKREWKE